MIDNPGHFIYKNLMRDESYQTPDFNSELISILLSDIIDILSKKLPTEINFNNSKLDAIISKIKLVPIPRSIVEESVIDM